VEGGSANAYDYGSGDSINNLDLDGTRCWTGVARRVEEEHYNEKTGKVEIKTREICRGDSVVKVVRNAACGYAGASTGVAIFTGATNAGIIGGFFVGDVPGAFVGGAAGAAAGYVAGRNVADRITDSCTSALGG
jgi:hypothetical protein